MTPATVAIQWKALLAEWERATASRNAIDRVKYPETYAVADREVDSASERLWHYKATVTTDFALVMRWIAEDPLRDDFLSRLFSRAAFDVLEPETQRLRARILTLEKQLQRLAEEVASLKLEPEVCKCHSTRTAVVKQQT